MAWVSEGLLMAEMTGTMQSKRTEWMNIVLVSVRRGTETTAGNLKFEAEEEEC